MRIAAFVSTLHGCRSVGLKSGNLCLLSHVIDLAAVHTFVYGKRLLKSFVAYGEINPNET